MTDELDHLKHALADRYAIARELGRGGMAVVFLAHDRKLDRDVALKVLRPELAAAVGPERFLREIAIAAKLTHPNILPLYDCGDADGQLYYTMPCLSGESLRDILTREKQLSIEGAVQITREVADALGYAHGQGIVHRDIKPENILFEAGHAVVSDFGIARAVTVARGDTLTESGLAIGTPLYMSPEQAAGDPGVDHRADIYSLGCVLYEMLSGDAPYVASTPQAVIAKKLSEPLPRVSVVRETVPAVVEQALAKALAKTPADRFSTAEQFSQALSLDTRVPPRQESKVLNGTTPWLRAVDQRRRQLLGIAAVVLLIVAGWYVTERWRGRGEGADSSVTFAATNIGVLPFQDFSEGEVTQLAMGLTHYLTRYLGEVRALKVVSPESMERYDRERFPLDSIIARHRLGTLVEGHLTATEDSAYVSVYLADANSRTQTASSSLVRPREEQHLLLRDLSESVGRLLRQQLGGQTAWREAEALTECGECLEAVFRARRLIGQAELSRVAGDSDGAANMLDQADSLLQVAESGDPQWTDPIVERSWVEGGRAQLNSHLPRRYDEGHARAGLLLAERAVEHSPSSARALEARGLLRSHLAPEVDSTEAALLWEGAQADLEQAVASMPSLAAAWSRLSEVYRRKGEFGLAKSAAERALAEDVFLANNETIIMRLCQAAFELEQLEEADHWCLEEGRQRFPRSVGFISFELALLASSVGPEPDVGRAWLLTDTLVEFMSPSRREAARAQALIGYVAGVLARAALGDSARSVIRRARAAAPAEHDPKLDYYEAHTRLNLGESEDAIRLLSRYLEAVPTDRAYLARDWWWRPLRGHPAFQQLIRPGG